MYKILAIDLDETLLTRDKEITEINKYWIQQARDKGVRIVIATGRAFPSMKQYYDELELKAPMIVSNGSEIWDSERRILHKDPMRAQSIEALRKIVSEYDVNYWLYGGQTVIQREDWQSSMIQEKWTQFILRDDRIVLLQEIKKQAELIENIEVTQSSPRMVEFTNQGISKASGMQWLCNYLNLQMNQVMFIGDNFNDMRLIKKAGLGVAMGNAEDQVKAVADVVTDTNEKDGVAKAIQQHLFQKAGFL